LGLAIISRSKRCRRSFDLAGSGVLNGLFARKDNSSEIPKMRIKNAGKDHIAKMKDYRSILAFDYDGTVATDGFVIPPTLEALEALLASGRKLILATGRQLTDLFKIFPQLTLFAWVIAENGAVVYETATGESEILGQPPPEEFLRALDERGIEPVSTGQAIVATTSNHAKALSALIRSMDLPHHVVLNKDSAMVLPDGVNKGSGLQWVLHRLDVSEQEVIGIGDGENDVDLFRASGVRVAVANAVPELKEMADWVTPEPAGIGVEQLSALLLNV
jgi:HAD superfamily hydrolase (TIGR01484 family)